MENRFDFPHRGALDQYRQHKPRRAGLEASGMNGTNSSPGKCNEKELMHGLNDRLAGFIEKVHHLEYQNQLLEREIQDIRGKAKPASHFEEEYGPELRRLRQLVQDITHQKHQIEFEHQSLEEDLSNLRKQCDQEARSRSDVESNIVLFKKDINDAYQAKLQLEKKAQALVDEIHFLKRNHEAEVSEMFDQIHNAQVTVKAHEFGNPGITAALRDIRAQLEGHAAADVQQVGESFRSQFARLTEAAESKREALKASQQEIQEYRRRLQAKNVELDCAKGTREALEKQLHDVEDRHKEEVIHYQNTIKELENELINCKFDMSGYLREYQDLLNVKMALDVEILSYRKLLCGEEARLSTVSDPHVSLPYIYHQSPIYTLPCLSRPGGTHRRVEPHYKFVEEIITETTREIEMSEFEETGSEETEAGKDEQEGAKSDRGGSEEEEEDDKQDKDSGEEEGKQMSDSQQNQGESVGNAVKEVADSDEGAPGEVSDGDEGQKRLNEPEENEAVNKEQSGVDKNTRDSFSPIDDKEEQNQKVAKNTEEENDAAVTAAQVQKEIASDPHDLISEVPVGREHDSPISVNDEKGDSVKESVISVQVTEPVTESQESDKAEELSSERQVKNKVPTSASEAVEKPGDFKEDTKSSSSVDTDKVEVTATPTTKSDKKEQSQTESKEKGECEAANGEDKAITIQEVRRESTKSQEKEPSPTSQEQIIPEVKDQRPKSGDKTETAKPAFPKELTDQFPQGAPDQALKSEKVEGLKELNDAQDKSLKAEISKPEK